MLCKSNWLEYVTCVSNFIVNPSAIRIGPSNKRISLQWLAPSLDSLKFNVDGTVSGSFGPAGIGGRLDPTSIEILVITEVVSLFIASKLVIETDNFRDGVKI
ncbi:hypothetical protein GQ457_01G001650 [Hibiscus cannabinus]